MPGAAVSPHPGSPSRPPSELGFAFHSALVRRSLRSGAALGRGPETTGLRWGDLEADGRPCVWALGPTGTQAVSAPRPREGDLSSLGTPCEGWGCRGPAQQAAKGHACLPRPLVQWGGQISHLGKARNNPIVYCRGQQTFPAKGRR